MPDLALRSRRTLTPDGLRDAWVLIKDKRIAGLLPGGSPVAGPVVDLGDKVLMPGLIDPHVHINEPGRTHWEGFDTATRAALAGGITTLVDMPLNSTPVTTTVRALEEKLAAAENQLHAHCGFWGGLVPGNEHEIEGLIRAGVLGFKAFLTPSGIADFPNVTEADLHQALPILARYDLPLLVHCELSQPHDLGLPQDKRSYRHYLASRPRAWEDEAIALMIRLCDTYRVRTHIVHLSSATALPSIAAAKEKGLPLTVETAPHYLYFHAEEIPDGHPEYKCAPPIREKENNDRLWDALATGLIDLVATDHSPAPPELKQLATGDLSAAWGGIASLQLSLPVLWTAARQRGLTLAHLARWLAQNPARLIGRAHHCGQIAPGYAADLVVLDPDKSFRVTESRLYHKHKATPYLGHTLWGVVEQTYLQGRQVYDGGVFTLLRQGVIQKNNWS
jgi:allantoinase